MLGELSVEGGTEIIFNTSRSPNTSSDFFTVAIVPTLRNETLSPSTLGYPPLRALSPELKSLVFLF